MPETTPRVFIPCENVFVAMDTVTVLDIHRDHFTKKDEVDFECSHCGKDHNSLITEG